MTQKVLEPLAFEPLLLNEIKPLGWLANQLRIQANGLSGHLDEFWPDIQDSAWIGGKAEGWERMPYWLDGAIPLAWLLPDAALKGRIEDYLDYILKHQHEDGWLGPRVEENPAASDVWSQLLALKMLLVYHDATGDDRAMAAIERALRSLQRHIGGKTLFNWGQMRWFEGLIALWRLYEKTGDSWLVDLAVMLHAQGFDWKSFFERWPMKAPRLQGHWDFMSHVVNNAMAIKANGLWWRLTGEETDRAAVRTMMDQLDRYHGTVTGVFSGDECLAGTSPVRGTELCAVVEYMFSLEVLLSVFGDSDFGDRLEKIAFNALPATFSPDMWAHQYDQQVNQVECSVKEGRCWNSNGPDANIYGLEPNYGCCTANLSQGWPKFAAHLWMKSPDGGLAAVAYAPSEVRTELNGKRAHVVLETDYPFRDELRFRVNVDRPMTFPLWLRIPAWAQNAVIECDGKRTHPQAGTFCRMEREWAGETELTVRLPMQTRLVKRPRKAVALVRGPLVYALRIGERWKRIHEGMPLRELPHADWEVYPTTDWNYALEIGEDIDEVARVIESRVGDCPYSPDGAPVTLVLRGRKVPKWGMENGSAQDVPIGPIRSAEKEEELQLIPYGCTNLRVTEFPVLAH